MKSKSAGQYPSAEGSGAFRTAESLTRAASPVFALMALLTLRCGDAQSLCGTAGGGAAWNSMATMYILMCIAHVPPWLRLLGR
jgi:hypothetical protein